MDILITGARAPVALEWARLALSDGHRVWLADSLRWPLGRFLSGIEGYLQLPSPRDNTESFANAVHDFLDRQQIDWLIPTCEEIFYLAQIRQRRNSRTHWLMPDENLLVKLHSKFDSLPLLDGLAAVRTPATVLCQHPDDIRDDAETILKPVYSRFGRQFIARPRPGILTEDQLNPRRPWVQQQRLSGEALCNYALFQHGQLIAHQAYRPLYRFNQAAASYFDPVDDPRLHQFAVEFGQRSGFHGQAAFDFIDQDGQLFCLECNPRATSGLHCLRNQLQINSAGDFVYTPNTTEAYRVGSSLPLLFSLHALRNRQWQQLWRDFVRAQDALKHQRFPLHFGAQMTALAEISWRALRYRLPLTDASTLDIEWNGPEVSP